MASSTLANLDSSLRRIYNDEFFEASLNATSPYFDCLGEPIEAPGLSLAPVGAVLAAALVASPEPVGRRGFLGRLAAAITGCAAGVTGAAIKASESGGDA